MAVTTNSTKLLLLMVLMLLTIVLNSKAQNGCNKTIVTTDFRQEGRFLKINFTIKDCPENYKFNIIKVVVNDLNGKEIVPKSLSGDSLNIPVNKTVELVWDVIKDLDVLEGIKNITITTDYTLETTQLIEKESQQKVQEEKLQDNSAGWAGGVHRFNFGLCVGLGAALPTYSFTNHNIEGNPTSIAVFGGLSTRILFVKFFGFQFDFIIQYVANAVAQNNYTLNKSLNFNVPLTFNLYFLKVLAFKTGVVFNKNISHEETFESSTPSYTTYTYDKSFFKNDILFDVGLGLQIKKRTEWMVEYQRSIINLANSANLPFTTKHNNNLLFHFRFFFLR